ncbi:MAG: Glu/Leu/Phe/Val dehydrogenase dimerization domain-containing protein [Pseudomonadota bacterium]
MFDHASFDDHEGVHVFHDEESGLKAIIAVHSTKLGPAAGGCRMWNYETGKAMVTDVLRLAQGMSYKNAMAGLPLGGGKAVIWGDPHKDKSPELFRAFGRAVESLRGKYWTAEDVGLSPGDLAAAAEETKYVAGLETGEAASGDPSPITALGVYRGILECAKRAFDTDDMNGKRVAVQGVGSVGGGVCMHLAKAGADLVVTDVHTETLSEVAALTGAEIVEPGEIYEQDVDIFSPNALGAIVNEKTLGQFKAKVIAGGANNQLATRDMGAAVREAGVLYAPDYVINGGGIINVAAEISGNYSRDWVDGKLDVLMDTLGAILDQGLSEARPTNEIADEVARQRIGRG